MTVAVAHQPSATGHLALREAAREASFRGTALAVIQVTDAVDLDVTEAHRAGLSDEVSTVLKEAGVDSVEWDLVLSPGTGTDDTADKILELATKANAELLVIGARRRSPVGKLILGSVTQTIILQANVPVLVVKAD
jgi:nucleotide-binding universal stress UspA family protein